jgi:hypothetical protein
MDALNMESHQMIDNISLIEMSVSNRIADIEVGKNYDWKMFVGNGRVWGESLSGTQPKLQRQWKRWSIARTQHTLASLPLPKTQSFVMSASCLTDRNAFVSFEEVDVAIGVSMLDVVLVWTLLLSLQQLHVLFIHHWVVFTIHIVQTLHTLDILWHGLNISFDYFPQHNFFITNTLRPNSIVHTIGFGIFTRIRLCRDNESDS